MRVLTLALACAAISSAASTSSQVTFYKDVVPVLQKNCQGCHRPGEAGPMSFMTYESTRPWAKAIKSAVASKKMPPWFADPSHGKFANDRSLSQAELNTLVSWVDAGAPSGNAKEGPAPIQFTEGWAIGKPDLIFEVPTAFEIPASGTIDYQYVIMHTGLTEDKYVQTAEARPSDRERTHHIIAFIREPGSRWFKDAPIGVAFVPEKGKDGAAVAFGGDFLAGYAPGTIPDILKPGQVKLLKAGSDIVFQLHYTANGKTGSDKSKVGVIFATDTPKERVLTLAAANGEFAIPPGNGNYRVDSKITLQADSTLESLLPHMHLRGKSFEYRVIYPSGETETLLSVPHYSFSWQLTYYLDKPKVLPKGTVIECTAYFDNSLNNPDNPDPTKEIKFGEQSWDEMMIGFFDVSVPLNVTTMDLLRAPKAAKKDNSGGE